MKRYLFLSLIICVIYGCKSGTVKYINTDNGKVVQQVFDNNGKKIAENDVKEANGKYIPDGVQKEFYPTGELKSIYFKLNGRDTGNTYSFYRSGVVQSMNIEKSKTFYSVHFDEFGHQIGNDLKYQLKHRDSAFVNKPIPVIIDALYYGRMITKIREQLYYGQNRLIWDTSFQKNCDGALCGESVYNPTLVIKERGVYTFKTSSTYVDFFSGIVILTDSATVTFHGL